MSKFLKTLAEDGVFTFPLNVPVDAEDRAKIDFAIWALERAIENDECNCEDEKSCTVEAPGCRFREQQAAMLKLVTILEPIHCSLHPERLSNPPEAIYLRRWIKENERSSSRNYRHTTLELLLTPTRLRRAHPFTDDRYFVPPVSQRDAEVAATVMQWLGTNCGMCFVRSAEQEIDAARMDRVAFEQAQQNIVCHIERVLPSEEVLAKRAAAIGLRADHPRYENLVKAIVAAIHASREKTPEPGTC